MTGRVGQDTIDHDRIFKELLTTFFLEFLQLFLPEIAELVDGDAEIVPMDKEIFTDIIAGERHEVDLVMKVKLRGKEAFFLIHVENQSTSQPFFPKRMFLYFARLLAKYDLPIYPIVIFSYDTPLRPEPQKYVVAFPKKTVLQFEYTVIQLNWIPWRRFVTQANPVACALMAKMKMAPKDRPRVKLECLRLLATLKLNPAKATLIGGFVDTYLKLNLDEAKVFAHSYEQLVPEEKEKTMKLMTQWHIAGMEEGKILGLQEGEEKGKQEGSQNGKAELLLDQMQWKFGSVPPQLTGQIQQLTSDQLNALGVAFLQFNLLSDLETWLTRQSA